MSNNFKKEIRDKSLDEKLDIVDKIADADCFSENDLKILNILSYDEESEIRYRVAETLVFFDSPDAEKILIRLVDDEDKLVRVNACDSLCNSKSIEVLNLLKERVLKDKSSLVRRYAALSISDIANNTSCNRGELVKFFHNAMLKEKVIGVKISFFKALYSLGEKAKINDLLRELNNRLYVNRCATVNVLSDIISNENKKEVKPALQKRYEVEKTVAVRSSIQNVLNEHL